MLGHGCDLCGLSERYLPRPQRDLGLWTRGNRLHGLEPGPRRPGGASAEAGEKLRRRTVNPPTLPSSYPRPRTPGLARPRPPAETRGPDGAVLTRAQRRNERPERVAEPI